MATLSSRNDDPRGRPPDQRVAGHLAPRIRALADDLAKALESRPVYVRLPPSRRRLIDRDSEGRITGSRDVDD